MKQEAGFRHDRLAGQQRRRKSANLLRCPEMMLIAAVEQRDERTSVEQDGRFHSPKPSMYFLLVDKSAGPSTSMQPIKCPASSATVGLSVEGSDSLFFAR